MSRCWWLGCLLIFATRGTAWADLIVAPSSGSVLMDGDPFDLDGTAPLNSGGSFQGKFYGASVGTIDVAENGNINFTNSGSYFPHGLTDNSNPDFTARIAPLWDDVLLFQPFNNRVIEHSVAGNYLAVTWENVLLFNDSLVNPLPQQSFQVLWFEADTNIRGFQFLANDIAFGYQGGVPGTNSFGNLYATVGVANGLGLFTPLPGDDPIGMFPEGDGYIESNAGQAGLLAWEPDTFMLFRPMSIPNQGYIASKQTFPLTPIPEPNSLIFVAIGLILTRRRKSRTADCS
jgi:hypothetical protein